MKIGEVTRTKSAISVAMIVVIEAAMRKIERGEREKTRTAGNQIVAAIETIDEEKMVEKKIAGD
jgi:hypothetical protein